MKGVFKYWMIPEELRNMSPKTFVARMQSIWMLVLVFFIISLFLLTYVSLTYSSNSVCLVIRKRKWNVFREIHYPNVVSSEVSQDIQQTVTAREDSMSDITAIETPVSDNKVVFGESGKRLPNCLIIGVRKGGTRALEHFLRQNPQIVTFHSQNINFFGDDNKFSQGLDWYKQQLPEVASNQVLIEKNADYFTDEKIPERVHSMNPSINLILSVRDPIDRLISDYYFLQKYAKENKATAHRFLELEYSLEDLLVNSTTKEIRYAYGGLYRSKYVKFMQFWLKWFPREQFYIVNGDAFSQSNPAKELRQIEEFLGVKALAKEEDFYFQFKYNYWCHQRAGCLGDDKEQHPKGLNKDIEETIRNYFRQPNQEFYKLVGQDFGWK